MFITISNLYPRPDQPTRGMFNLQLFKEMKKILDAKYRMGDAGSSLQHPAPSILNLCLVPEWRLWRWPAIRRWRSLDTGCRIQDARSSIQPPASSISTHYLPVFYLPLIGRAVNDRLYAFALRSWAASVKPGDVVYGSWLYPDGAAVAGAIRGRGVRLWLMALGTDTFHLQAPSRRRRVLEACQQAEGIVCVAQVLADRLAAAGVPREKLHVVPNGVDTSLFRREEKNELLSCQVAELFSKETSRNPLTAEQLNNSTTVLFVGNLVPVKGPDVMLRAFALMVKRELLSCSVVQLLSEETAGISATAQQLSNSTTLSAPPLSNSLLLIIGSGPMRKTLEQQAAQLGIADRVHFLGARPHAELPLWMNRADLLCLASRSEGMPNVVLEARACGLPVVTTPAGALPELPLARDHFLVVKSCDPEPLAAGLAEMLRRDRSTRAPDPAIPSWSQQAARILDLIHGAKGV